MIVDAPSSFFTLQGQQKIILLGPSLEMGVQLYCFNLDYLSPTIPCILLIMIPMMMFMTLSLRLCLLITWEY